MGAFHRRRASACSFQYTILSEEKHLQLQSTRETDSSALSRLAACVGRHSSVTTSLDNVRMHTSTWYSYQVQYHTYQVRSARVRKLLKYCRCRKSNSAFLSIPDSVQILAACWLYSTSHPKPLQPLESNRNKGCTTPLLHCSCYVTSREQRCQSVSLKCSSNNLLCSIY